MNKSIKNPYQPLPTLNPSIQSTSTPPAASDPETDPPIPHGGDEESVPSLDPPKPPKQIALIPLIALIYFEVAGGPYGEEAAVGATGPLFAILGFLVFPFIWSIPEALITAELATTFPGNGGFVIWAHKAFGPFWGSMMGSWKFLSGVINLASYPALCIEYLKLVIPALSSGLPYYTSVFTFTSILSFLNYTGLSIVGYTAVTLGIVSLLPFVIMCLVAIPKIDPSRWISLGEKGVTKNWSLFFNTLFWNLNFWDNASTLAGEVENPQKTFPKALFSAGILTCLAYLLPLLAAIGAIPLEQEKWVDGYFADAAEIIVGKWLMIFMEVGAVLSIIGLFEAQLSSCAYQFLGMADLGFLPRSFGERSKWFNTPWVGILVSMIIAVAISCLDFSDIIASVNFLYSLGMLLEFASFLWLRRKMPAAKRPYRVPLGMVGLIIMCVIPSGFLIYVMFTANMAVLLVSAALTGVGVLWYFLMNICKEKKWIEFNSGHDKVEDQSQVLQPEFKTASFQLRTCLFNG